MKAILNLFAALFALLVLAVPAQAKGKLIPPSEEGCLGVMSYAVSSAKQGKQLPPKSRAFKKLCEDSYKNPHKYDWQTERFVARPLGD
jgi:hypothetical protein